MALFGAFLYDTFLSGFCAVDDAYDAALQPNFGQNRDKQKALVRFSGKRSDAYTNISHRVKNIVVGEEDNNVCYLGPYFARRATSLRNVPEDCKQCARISSPWVSFGRPMCYSSGVAYCLEAFQSVLWSPRGLRLCQSPTTLYSYRHGSIGWPGARYTVRRAWEKNTSLLCRLSRCGEQCNWHHFNLNCASKGSVRGIRLHLVFTNSECSMPSCGGNFISTMETTSALWTSS